MVGAGEGIVWALAPLPIAPPGVCGQLVRSLQCGGASAPSGDVAWHHATGSLVGAGEGIVWALAPLPIAPPGVCGQLVRSLQCGGASAPSGDVAWHHATGSRCANVRNTRHSAGNWAINAWKN